MSAPTRTFVVLALCYHCMTEVQDVAWSPCETRLATCSLDISIMIWDVTEAGLGVAASSSGVLVSHPIRELKGHSASVQGLAWDPANKVGVVLAELSWMGGFWTATPLLPPCCRRMTL